MSQLIKFSKENEYAEAVKVLLNYSYENNLNFKMGSKKVSVTDNQGFLIEASPYEVNGYKGRILIDGNEKKVNDLANKLNLVLRETIK